MSNDDSLNFAVPDSVRALVDEVRTYVDEVALPAEERVDSIEELDVPGPIIDDLRAEARRRGLFSPSMPPELGGLGIGTIGLALVAEACGISTLASIGLNVMAPDEGNMHVLLEAATEEQRERWLRPLAEGRVRSCFLMTEPGVSSSDPLNIATVGSLKGDEWVLRGRKWMATGARGAAFAIVVARTGDPSLRSGAYSLFIVPADAPGFEVVREPSLIGPHYPGGHPEVELDDVRVPMANLLGGVGQGYALSQVRLATGRLGHAMRWIGIGQRALDLAATRLVERESFGRSLAEHQAMQQPLADSAIELHAGRLMVLHAAWKTDRGEDARQEIAMTKTFVSEALGRILDRAVQAFGGAGVSHDSPVAQWYLDARSARIYDGPSEVHRVSIARRLLSLAQRGETTASVCGGF